MILAKAKRVMAILRHGPAMPWHRWYIRKVSTAIAGGEGGYIPWWATYQGGKDEVDRLNQAIRRIVVESELFLES